ncbi:MAG: 50S ribosomal protein L4 [Armatimonadota bacterium]
MSTIPVYNLAGEPSGEIELAPKIFEAPINEALIHQSVVTTLANRRQGTADTKTRAEVSHTTKKLYRQKGTGRARQGMRSAPHYKGGGVVFGPHPRDYSMSLPKKMRRAALLSALTVKANDNGIIVVKDFAFEEAKTRQAAALLNALKLGEKKRVLLVVRNWEEDELAVRAFRNLANVDIITAEMLGTYDVLTASCLLFDQASLEKLQDLKQQPLGILRWMAKQQEAEQGGAV